MRGMIGKIIVVSTAAAVVLLLVLLQVTNPSTAGPLGILAVFFLLYVIILGIITELLWIGSYTFQKVGRRFMVRRPPVRMTLARAYYISTVVALGPVMMLAMKSIGSLGIYEAILIILFVAIALLYVLRRSSR